MILHFHAFDFVKRDLVQDQGIEYQTAVFKEKGACVRFALKVASAVYDIPKKSNDRSTKQKILDDSWHRIRLPSGLGVLFAMV